MKNKKALTVIGNVGSGKSTIVPLLAEALSGIPVYADDLFQTTDPFRGMYFKNMKRWAFANELWLVKERVKLMKQEVVGVKGRWLIIDSGMLMSWAYTYSHYLSGTMSPLEWKLFDELFDSLTEGLIENGVVASLECDTDSLLKRIKQRGRDYEIKYYSKKYLEDIGKGLKELIKKIEQAGMRVIKIKESELGDFSRLKAEQDKLVEMIILGMKQTV